MNSFSNTLLTLIIFFPMVGVFFLLISSKDNHHGLRRIAFINSLMTFILSLFLLRDFIPTSAGMQFVELRSWIPEFGISYHLGIDGISLFLVLLTTLLSAIAVLASFTAITKQVKEYFVCLLLLETGMLGVFCSLDMVLFFFFWEVMLIPMYFLIGIWGGDRRIYASIKFVLYTMAGSALMLVAILVMYFTYYSYTGEYSFDVMKWYQMTLPAHLQLWLFLAFFLAFAIKVPLFPFHTWLPDAHTEAPTAGSVILAGVLLKMGTYGLVRFCLPLFPYATMQCLPIVCVLALIGIIYGAWVAMVQPDVKKLVAYSSVAHLGYVVLGIFVLNIQGLGGGLLQMINHGLSTGALFLLVGMIYERRHTREISQFGGLAKVMPIFFGFFLIVTLSSIGLPGMNGFVGEYLILVGAFQHNIVYAVIATLGIIFAAVYMLWMFQRVMFGEITHEENKTLKDLSKREIALLIPIIILIFWIGIYPKPFLSRMEPSLNKVLQKVHSVESQPLITKISDIKP